MAWRVLDEKDFGWKSAAYFELSRIGTTNDLKKLLPLSDYWTGDWTNHYWATMAVRSIRGRHGHDMNGPIKPMR